MRRSPEYYQAYMECRFERGESVSACRKIASEVEAHAEGLGRTPRLLSTPKAIERLKRTHPEAIVDHLPSWIEPFAEYMATHAPLAKGRITPRDAIKAYLLTKSSVQRSALKPPTVCSAFPESRVAKAARKSGGKVRPEDIMAELLLTPTGKAFLDDAERGVFNEEAAKRIADAFACFGLVYPGAGADLSDPATLSRSKSLFVNDLRRAPRIGAQTDTWCIGVRKKSKSYTGKVRRDASLTRKECYGTREQAADAVRRKCKGKKKCSWGIVPPLSHILQHADPATYYRWAQKYLPGIDAAKVGFFASLLGRGDIPTFDAREIKLWYRYPHRDPNPRWSDVERLRERLEEFPMRLPERYEPFRSHLVHHALWDQYPTSGPPTRTTHEELVEAMQFAGPLPVRRRRRRRRRKPTRRKPARRKRTTKRTRRKK